MNNEPQALNVTPPRLIATMVKGFNIVANQAYLILIPIFLDILLWLGPKLRVRDLILPAVNSVSESMLRIGPSELAETVTTSQTLWQQLLEQLNLLTAIRTIPVGVPSLIARQASIVSPISQDWVFEITSMQAAVGILGGLLLAGFFLGTIYFEMISRTSTAEPEQFSWNNLFFKFVQSLLLFLVLILVALIISFPVLFLISVLSLVSPGIAQFIVLMVLFLLVWLIVPLVFSAHGIFALKQKVLPSMLLSMRMVRFFLPGTGMFIFSSILLSEGFNMLWVLPEPDSWLLLVGIFGHAFIVTALLAGSFIYYREGLSWMQFNIQRINQAKQQQQNGGKTIDQQ